MGFFQAPEGIDSKSNIIVTGSISTTEGIDSKGNITITGSISTTITPTFPSITTTGNVQGADLIATDDLFVEGMTASTSQSLELVAYDSSNGQLYYADAPTQIARPTTFYQNTFNSTLTINNSSGTTIFDIQNGTLNIDPTGGSTDKIVIGLAAMQTNFSCAVNNVSSAFPLDFQVTTPSGAATWQVYWFGYVSSTNERWRVVNTDVSGGTGVTSSRKLDFTGRAEVSMDYSESKIFIWASNWV